MDVTPDALAGKNAGAAAPMRLIILGATGSIGLNTLDIIARNPDRFHVTALIANSNIAELARQAHRVRPDVVVTADPEKGAELSAALSGSGISTGSGRGAVLEAIDRPADMVVGAIVGAAGLEPTLAALKPGRILALANKECLVSAGDLFMARAQAVGVTVLPVDSEHNAVFQVFEADNADQVEKIILTASGGPFRSFPKEALVDVTPEQALKHPNWDMGRRISIDSATLMNKGFEVIEAFHLFPVHQDQLAVLVHPQSIVHGLVQYADGSLLAQLGAPDMRTPIARCLAWPERMVAPVARLDLAEIATLTFEKPDLARFPALALALSALDHGSRATAALNAADEVAVAGFLSRRIGFMDIPAAVEHVVDAIVARTSGRDVVTLEDVLAIDFEARTLCTEWMSRHGR